MVPSDYTFSPSSFEDLHFNPHAWSKGGKQALAGFPNGYGASVVQFDGSYGYEQGLWELAVIEVNEGGFDLTYKTPITDDVLGHLAPEDVTETLQRIAALPGKVYA